jgi:O-antigen ligase
MPIRKTGLRWLPARVGTLVVFLLTPVWLRVPPSTPMFSDLYVARFVLFLVMGLTVIAWLLTGLPGFTALRRDRLRAGWLLTLLLMALWMFATGAWAFMGDRFPELATGAAVQFSMVVLFTLVTACVSVPPRWIAAALVFGLIWNAGLAGAQVAEQGSVGGIFRALGEFPLGVNLQGISYLTSGDLRWLRPYGLLPHPNVLAGWMAVGLLVLIPWLARGRGFILALLVLTGTLWAFGLTFSRGAWLGLASGAFALLPLAIRLRWPRRRLIAAVLVAGAVAAAFFVTYRPLILARAGAGGENVELYSVGERSLLIGAALAAIYDQPLRGIGAANFPWYASYEFYDAGVPLRGNNVHHYLLSAWAEIGAVGLALVVMALVLGIEAALRSIRRGERDRHTRAALLAGFTALVASGLVDHYVWSLLQMQTLWWGVLAAALSVDGSRSLPVMIESNQSNLTQQSGSPHE